MDLHAAIDEVGARIPGALVHHLPFASLLLVDLEARGDAALGWAQAHDVVLSPQERGRGAQLRSPREAQLWLGAHVVLRHVLGAATKRAPGTVDFHRSEHGKPRVPGAEFSLSHSRGLVAVAVSAAGGGGGGWEANGGSGACAGHVDAVTPDDRAAEVRPATLGVDVEAELDPRAASDILPLLHPAERRELEAMDPAAVGGAAAQLWARKEAFLKALGLGLSRDLSLDLVGAGPSPLTPSGWEGRAKIVDLPTFVGAAGVRYRAAVCALQGEACSAASATSLKPRPW